MRSIDLPALRQLASLIVSLYTEASLTKSDDLISNPIKVLLIVLSSNLRVAAHMRPIHMATHLGGVPFGRVMVDGEASVNVLPLKVLGKLCLLHADLISIELTTSSFSGSITKTYGVMPLGVDLGSKKLMVAFFIVENTSNCNALLGIDWIQQALCLRLLDPMKMCVLC